MEFEEQVPSWSGVPTFEGEDADIAVLPMHVSDRRSIHIDGFKAVNHYESLDGEIEYHIFERCFPEGPADCGPDDGRIRIPLPSSPESESDQEPPELR
jgi:hypothetical protein